MKILERELNKEQLEIAKAAAEGRSLVVIAGPGTGKTHLLTHVAAHRVRTSHPAPWKVLCLTFSVEATKQLRTRLREPALGIRAPSRLEIANFHQFGSRLLGAYGHHLKGPDGTPWPRQAQVLDEAEARDLAVEVIAAANIQGVNPSQAAEAIHRYRYEGAQTLRPPRGTFEDILRAYEERLWRERVRDFDDLVLHATRLLEEQPRIAGILAETFRFIVVDELQDSSMQQMQLVWLIAGKGTTPVFAVGDNDQMIYAWRDAKPRNLTWWENRFGSERHFLLGNYRCAREIVSAADALIQHNPHPENWERPYSLRKNPGAVYSAEAMDVADEAQLVGEIVEAEIARGVQPGEIAVLASKHAAIKAVEDVLRLSGIPRVRVGDDAAEQRPVAKGLRAALTLVVAPDSPRARRRLADVCDAAPDLDEIIELLRDARTCEGFLERLEPKLRRVVQHTEDVEHARKILALAQRESPGEPPTAIGRNIALEWHRLNVQLQRETESVKLMTTLAAKGLGFRVVIVTAFRNGEMPHVYARGQQLLEERRKAYVAMTRAEEHLHLVWSDPGSPYLDEIGAANLTPYDRNGLH